MAKRVAGIWFYGLAGSGKTHASNLLAKKISQPYVIDGDAVRTLISFDLGYTLIERCTQIKRILGISKLTIQNEFFPIASSVFMTQQILNECRLNSIEVIEISRSRDQLHSNRKIYENNKNVVGKDIIQSELETTKMFNDGSDKFEREVLNYVEQIK
jgi:adenylylsulfate kinase-like enzyme